MERPLILVTNDDGFTAKGIKSLIDAVSEFGNLLIVAPDKPQSGMGHAITVNEPLRISKSDYFKGHDLMICSGTPVDCIKMGIYKSKGKLPDLIVSGINHGSNVATNVLYSGTMSAAVEGALEGIPSIGFSLMDYDMDADFEPSMHFVKKIVKEALDKKMEKGICLNVNIPKLPLSEIKGVKVCRQARAFWDDTFDERTDPLGKQYYWLAGEFHDQDNGKDTDMFALDNNYVSIVPTQFDMTAYNAINQLNKWKL